MTVPDLGAPTPMGRIAALTQVLRPHQVRASLVLGKQPSLRISALAGLQAAAAGAVALPIFYVSPWPQLIGFAALGAMVALFGRFSAANRRGRILLWCALCQSLAVFVMSAVAWTGMALPAQLALLSLGCGVFFFAVVSGGFGPPGALIFTFAAGAAMAPPDGFHEVLGRTAATGAVAILAWGICAASEALRRHSPEAPALPVDQLRPLGHRLIAALRIVVGAGIAIFASHALGVAHPVWAAMGTIAVMQGAYLHINMHRALQRMVGTVVGAAFAWVFLQFSPSPWAVMAGVVVLQFVAEVIIGTNYGLGQIAVTPMALLMVHLASLGAAGPEMAAERVIDTLLGAAVGIVIAIVFSTLDERHYLALQAAERQKRRAQRP
ncbi:FUSC family protein [Pleomorphomonas sp. PLEO]|uniref:FUSC family protein n=1 Tax=Pleomorphomonas sp. PLEO TaxID=3239306 RepID=UPI00351F2796